MKPILSILVWYQCIVQLQRAWSGSVSRGDYAEVRLFRAPAAYDVDSAVLLNDLTKKDKEVGYKIKGQLHVLPVWADSNSEFLLKFRLIEPHLLLRGKHINADFRRFDSIWDSHRDSIFYAHWKNGIIETAYLDSSDPVDILNYKKSLVSLFQFQIIDGEYNETDISGTCDVSYESISTDVFRKTKSGCALAGTGRSEAELVSARRVARYTLGGAGAAAALQAVLADEQLELGSAALGVKARSWQRLQLAPDAAVEASPASPASPTHHSLDEARAALPAALAPSSLALDGDDPPIDDMSLEEALAASEEALQTEEAGLGGDAGSARAALRLVRAMRAADAGALTALLHAAAPVPRLRALCRLLGLAGTRAAHAAADAFLQLRARDALVPLARDYLAHLALSDAPEPGVVGDVARLAAAARAPAVAAAALLAAAAAAPRLPHDGLARELRDDLARDLARCKDDSCRALRLTALGHLRRADGAELLLEHAERAGRAPALAALDALAALPPDALHVARRRRLERIALQPGRTLEVRAAALDLLVERSAARPVPLAETALALHAQGPRELRRLFWQRVGALAEHSADARHMLRLLPVEVKAWHAQAHSGTSSALRRGTGWARGGWAAELDSLQVAAAGLLRRGRVALHARAPDNSTRDLLAVEVWTRGLEALAGGAEQPDPALDEGEAPDAAEAAGGLALGVGGVRLPAVQLFAGQAELLGHVWAGTGSTATPVLRALLPLRARAGRLALLAGARVAAQERLALALALDAQAQVSLWSRNARALLELRAGGAGEARLRLRAAWGAAEARAELSAAPRLRIAADLDFYSTVALCVRVRLEDYDDERVSWQESSLGGGGGGGRVLHVRRGLNATTRVPGRTLSLGGAADRACRTLRAADDD